MNAQIQENIIGLWGGYVSEVTKPQFSLSLPPAPISTLFSSRNLELLSKSANPKLTWDKFEHFVGRLLRSGTLHPIELEEQCIKLLKPNQTELPEHISPRLGSCLSGVIDSWKKQNVRRNQEDLLNFTEEFLEWFAWLFSTINDLDEFDDSLENFPELTI